ncbi:carbohydrate ABC transporter permease [Paenibacillus sp. KQZ6P-2]|uniref:Carbohydrate ABC transporter permease n=1 Tax=Paenibacillus mangrovi TaxID=2931978 RepID=A0A9X1WRB4_9BACL|nr:carbohydrate ABC transporter permease [Paenibacillus mangrovi]MCJ8013644.1 carbohydrate ABC transporter permease [Paenibacillus mangrovi]
MVSHASISRKIFVVCNYVFLMALSLLCVLPLVHIFAVSLSSGAAASAGIVKLWPVEFTTAAYQNIFDKPQYFTAFWVSVKRVLLGTGINLLLTITAAYPLSKDSSYFRPRTVYVWIFVITMLFSGGLIPWFMTIKATGLMDSIWALVLPSAVPVFNVILLLNFFRSLPKELEESARIDGAGHFMILWKFYVPLSLPALATITLFSMVGHWNSWFDGLILMNNPDNYPLQTFLQTIVISKDPRFLSAQEAELLLQMSDRTSTAAQIYVAALPILLVYPFLQRFFVKGIVMGSVKE